MRRSSRRSSIAVSLHQSLDNDAFTKANSRRSSLFAPPPPEESRTLVGNFTTKFSMTSFVNRVEHLSDDQKKVIGSVGFGNLLLLPHHTLRKNLLVEWMERWDTERRGFVLLDQEVTITPLDVALILGLPATGKPVSFSSDEPLSHLEEEYGATRDSREISLSAIERRLESLGDSTNEDFVRIFLLYTFGTLLFHNSNGKVDSRYLTIFQDLSKISDYAWGIAVIEDVFNWLSRKKEKQIKSIEGCLILLQIWSYEHIDIGRPNQLSGSSEVPRACRWESSRSNTPRHWFTTKFNELEEDEVVWQLQPVAAELSIPIIKVLVVAETEGIKARGLQNLNTKTTRAPSQCTGLPPKSFSQRVAVDAKEERVVGVRKPDLQTECPDSSCISTDVSGVTVDYPECSSSFGMQEVVDDQDDHRALKTENTKLKKENVELKRELDRLRSQSTTNQRFEDMIASLKKEIADLKEENLYFRSAAAFIEELERITPEEFDGLEFISEDKNDVKCWWEIFAQPFTKIDQLS